MPVIDKLKKPKVDLKAELKLADAPHPDERWEGVWTFKDDESSNSLHATVRLLFAAGLIEGRGAMSHEGQHILDADISGAAAGDELAFTTFIGNGHGVNGSLICTGALSDERSRMSGSFRHACFNPQQCDDDCEGGWGDFEMRRIVDAG